jgi:hypothetical protein
VIVKISECSFGLGKDPAPEIMRQPIRCEQCSAKISGDVALSFEGADYIRHFCGPGCLDAWCRGRRLEPSGGASSAYTPADRAQHACKRSR